MLPTAKEMRQKVKDSNKEIKLITKAIVEAAEQGNYSVDFEFPSTTSIITLMCKVDYLTQEKGYQVKHHKDNPYKITISW
jgi:hypothetical protein